jgi:hypothetical protein
MHNKSLKFAVQGPQLGPTLCNSNIRGNECSRKVRIVR